MIRRLMASSAMIALMAAGAFSLAQAQTEQPATTEQPMLEQPATGTDAAAPAAPDAAATDTTAAPKADIAAGEADEVLTPENPTIATAFIGQSVFASQEPESNNIGEVNDLIIGQDGMITHAVVGVGGFLGIGEKNVAVPFNELQVVEDEDGDIRLIYAATKEQLEAAEAFDRTAYDPSARAAEEQAAAVDAAATDAPAGAITPAPAPAPAADTAAAPAADTAAAPAEAPAEPTTTIVAAEPADATEQPEAEDTAAATGMATEGFMSYSADQVRASAMIGQEVYGADNESIGEVSDLILQEDGKTRAALIDVGGFLGIGEKRVAIPFSDIKVQMPAEMQSAMTTDPAAPAADAAAPAVDATAPAADATAPAPATDPAAPAATTEMAAVDTEPRLTVDMTREQLEQLPTWEDPTLAATDAAMTEQTTATAPADPNAPADANAPADQQMAATDQYEPVTQELSADNLIGSAVFGQNEENLGEVGDVVFDPQGAIQAVVVDVGGFLGIGEKPVAIQYDALNVQKNGAGDFRLMVNATQEQLEAAPSYDVSDATAAAPAQ